MFKLIYGGVRMQVIREFREIVSDEIIIKIPKSFKEKRVEIIILPAEKIVEKETVLKKIHLTTYKCNGKKKDFSRVDAYQNRI